MTITLEGGSTSAADPPAACRFEQSEELHEIDRMSELPSAHGSRGRSPSLTAGVATAHVTAGSRTAVVSIEWTEPDEEVLAFITDLVRQVGTPGP